MLLPENNSDNVFQNKKKRQNIKRTSAHTAVLASNSFYEGNIL